MATTQLSPFAIPGRRYSFLAKTPVTPPAHAGEFTKLSVTATPGPKQSFLAKTPAVPPAHTGEFTKLSVIGVPGPKQSFLAKTEYIAPPEEEIIIEVEQPRRGGVRARGPTVYVKKRQPVEVYGDIHRDDQEILEIIIESILSGILE